MATICRGIFLTFVINNGFAYNIDTKSAILLKGNEDNGDGLFGHSVAFSEEFVAVGAPKDQTHGNVYKCSTSSSSNCQIVNVDDVLRPTLSWQKFFFGATVSINFINKNISSCAHLAPLHQKYLKKDSSWTTFKFGKCYSAKPGQNFNQLFELETSSYSTKNSEGRIWNSEIDVDHPWKVLGMMGPNHISTAQGEIVFSAPYATIGISKDDHEKSSHEKSRLVGTIIQNVGHKKIVADGNWKEQFIPNEGESFYRDPHVFDETGYAIVQGNFFPTSESGRHFAVGAPNANRLTGRVYICYKCFRPDKERKVRIKDGSRIDPSLMIELKNGRNQTGARFGNAVAAVDINGDGFDDLVVGAPLHSEKGTVTTEGVGRIYIYETSFRAANEDGLDNRRNRIPKLNLIKEIKATSLTEGGRFGFSISNIGSIDGDKFEDFAVGAPGVDGTGVIYIFNGNKLFNFDKVPQIIPAEDFNLPISLNGFGYALSKEEIDIDHNNYNDLVVGAPFADSAIILKSRQVLSFEKNFEIKPIEAVDPENQEFDLELSLVLKNRNQISFDQLYANIKVQFNDDRVDFQDKEKIIQVPLKQNQYPKLQFIAKIPKFNVSENDLDEPKPIRIQVDTNLTIICKPGLNCPVLHSSISRFQKLDFKVELLSGCKSDVCLCKLTSKLKAKNIDSVIVAGKDDQLELTFDVTNNGTEPGYGAKLNFNSNIPLRSTASTSKNGKEFEYKLRKVRKGNTNQLSMTFKFDPMKFQDESKLEITPLFESKCKGQDTPQSMETIAFSFEFKSIIGVTASKPASELFDEKTPYVTIKHNFDFFNMGPSYTNEEKTVRLFLPKADFIESMTVKLEKNNCTINTEPLLQPKQTPKKVEELEQLFCKENNCTVYDCKIAKLWMKDEFKKVSIEMEMRGSNIPPSAILMFSLAEIVGDDRTFNATTHLKPRELGATEHLKANWAIYLGVSLGVLMAFGAVLILWKTGVLAKMRPYKLDEEVVKAERRKSRMRMSMMPPNPEELQMMTPVNE